MEKIKKYFAGILAAALLFALVLGAALTGLPKKAAVLAERSDNFTVIGSKEKDLFQIPGSNINGDLLRDLLQALAGVDTYEELENKLNADPDGAMTSADFRAQQGGDKNVSVWFGGKKWDAVYLTKTRDYDPASLHQEYDERKTGIVALTLWQSADDNLTTSDWSRNYDSEVTSTYPSNMYSTSRIRVETLNNGGYAATGGEQIPEEPYESKTDENENTYARFTVSHKMQYELTDFILEPKYFVYQETENSNKTCDKTNSDILHNDAYGEPADMDDADIRNDYSNKGNHGDRGTGRPAVPETYYDAWKNDFLWLPSLAETGNSDEPGCNGVWETDGSLRSAVSSGEISNAWLRTGYWLSSLATFSLDSSGNATIDGSVTSTYLVRPAFHLNLKEISEAATDPTPRKPEADGSTVTYDGDAHTLTLPHIARVNYVATPVNGGTSFWNGDTHTITATDAGEYTVTATPETVWVGGTSDPVTYTLTLEKAEYTAHTLTASDKVYNGAAATAAYTAEGLPAGLTAIVKYKGRDGTEYAESESAPVDVGKYTATLSFTGENSNYNAIEEKSVDFEIKKATVDIHFEDRTVEYDGTAKSIAVTETLPAGVTVEYTYEGINGTTYSSATPPTEAGEYKVTATFTTDENYEPIEDKYATLKIVKPVPPAGSGGNCSGCGAESVGGGAAIGGTAIFFTGLFMVAAKLIKRRRT